MTLSIDPGSILHGSNRPRRSLNGLESQLEYLKKKGVLTSSTIFSANLVDCTMPTNSLADSSSSEYKEVLAESSVSLEWEQWLSKVELSSSSRMRVSAKGWFKQELTQQVSGPNKQTNKQTSTLLQLSCMIWWSIAHHARTTHGGIFIICQLELKTWWTGFFKT